MFSSLGGVNLASKFFFAIETCFHAIWLPNTQKR